MSGEGEPHDIVNFTKSGNTHVRRLQPSSCESVTHIRLYEGKINSRGERDEKKALISVEGTKKHEPTGAFEHETTRVTVSTGSGESTATHRYERRSKKGPPGYDEHTSTTGDVDAVKSKLSEICNDIEKHNSVPDLIDSFMGLDQWPMMRMLGFESQRPHRRIPELGRLEDRVQQLDDDLDDALPKKALPAKSKSAPK